MNEKVEKLITRNEIDDDLRVVDYVAGRLDDEARAAFEAELEADAELRDRVAEERAFRSTLSSGAGDERPDAAAFDKIRDRLGEEPVKRPSPWRRGTIAAVLAAAAAVVFFNYIEPGPGPADFETLSSEEMMPVAESRQVRIVFDRDVVEADRLAAAEELGFTLVGGPGAGGSWIVETNRPMTREELVAWRDDDRVDFAEPVRYQPEK